MSFKNYLRRILLGSSLPNEYICTPNDSPSPLQVMLQGDRGDLNVTESHVLLGYKPLMIGLSFQDEEWVGWASQTTEIRISLRDIVDTEIAWLKLKKVRSWRMGEATFVLYQGMKGHHNFIGFWNRFSDGVYELLRSRKPGNISLPAKLYNQVRIAYAVPRKVSLMVVGDDRGYNIFPSDLHGAIGKGFYAGSLRIGSKACRQVEEHEKIMIADMDVAAYRETYALGRNHMGGLQPLAILPVSDARSERWKLPIPKGATGYKELQRKYSWDMGIHRVHFYEVVGEKIIDDRVAKLCHIHRYYAQWRLDQRLDSKYLFRQG